MELKRIQIKGHPVLDTTGGLLKWTLSITAALLILHTSASLGLFTGYNWYNDPRTAVVDVFTHSLAGMSVALWILNFNVTKSRIVYWPIAVAATIIVGIAWEGFEEVASRINPAGTIQVFGFQDTIKDLWQDILGGIVASFIADETVE